MATYSNQEIQTLTQQATATPQFSGPKTNVLSGIADIASVGLQAYGKSKAREDLAAARVQQEAEAERFASESNKRADYVMQLKANPDMTPLKLNQMLSAYDRELEGRTDAGFARSVRQDLNASTGLTVGGVMTSSQKEAVRLDNQKKVEQEAKEAETLVVMEAGVQTGTYYSQEEVANMSPTERLQVQADANAAAVEQQQKATDYTNAQDQFAQDKNNLAEVTEKFVSATLPAEANKPNVSLQQALTETPLDASGNLNLEGIFSVLNGFETQISTTVAEIVERGKGVGARVPPETSAALNKQLDRKSVV